MHPTGYLSFDADFYRTAIDGLTSQEVAAELGITPLAVRKAKSRVLQRLKEALGGNLPPT